MFGFIFRKEKLDKELADVSRQYYHLKHVIEYNKMRIEKIKASGKTDDETMQVLRELEDELREAEKKVVEASIKKREVEYQYVK